MNTELIKKVLPWIGAAASGNVPALVAMAASAVGSAIGSPVKADPAEISNAVANAPPEAMAALRQAEMQFSERMQEMGFANIQELERIAAGDRANARGREIATGDHRTPQVLAGLAIAGFISLTVSILLGAVPGSEMRDVLMILVGAAIAIVKDVYGYYFGSSSGSRQNQDVLRGIASGK